jgi:hypothetical protein
VMDNLGTALLEAWGVRKPQTFHPPKTNRNPYTGR